jgi:hypothetical protein
MDGTLSLIAVALGYTVGLVGKAKRPITPSLPWLSRCNKHSVLR